MGRRTIIGGALAATLAIGVTAQYQGWLDDDSRESSYDFAIETGAQGVLQRWTARNSLVARGTLTTTDGLEKRVWRISDTPITNCFYEEEAISGGVKGAPLSIPEDLQPYAIGSGWRLTRGANASPEEQKRCSRALDRIREWPLRTGYRR